MSKTSKRVALQHITFMIYEQLKAFKFCCCMEIYLNEVNGTAEQKFKQLRIVSTYLMLNFNFRLYDYCLLL